MRWTTKLQGVQQETELVARLLVTDTEQLQYRFLQFRVMDTDRAATQLGAIKYHVIGARQAGTGVRYQVRRIVRLRCRKGMMQRHPATGFRIALEHRKINHPDRLPVTHV